MNFKRIGIFLSAILLLIVAILSLSDDVMTPYVTVAEAKEAAGKLVQVIGKLDKDTSPKHTEKEFFYSILDNKEVRMNVVYTGVKPQNFERADQIVTRGKYDTGKNIFVADRILVKCPSKYEAEHPERIKGN
jgi:cytochrome c-type biogenesis protein CcmE